MPSRSWWPGRGEPAARAEARSLARAALAARRDDRGPPGAASRIADSTPRGRATAHLSAFAERMSRRDLPTQLWLIEERVRRNDIAGALAPLRHRAAHRRQAAPNCCSRCWSPRPPMTASSGRSPALLRTDPPWRQAFLFELAQAPPSGRNAVAPGAEPRCGAARPRDGHHGDAHRQGWRAARDFDLGPPPLSRWPGPETPTPSSATAASPARRPSRPSNGRWWARAICRRSRSTWTAPATATCSKCARRAAPAASSPSSCWCSRPAATGSPSAAAPLSETGRPTSIWRIVCVNRRQTASSPECPIVARARPPARPRPPGRCRRRTARRNWLALAVRPAPAPRPMPAPGSMPSPSDRAQ